MEIYEIFWCKYKEMMPDRHWNDIAFPRLCLFEESVPVKDITETKRAWSSWLCLCALHDLYYTFGDVVVLRSNEFGWKIVDLVRQLQFDTLNIC